ncbi:hypothetical protein AUR66_05010 [Haloferax profundi]|uniref:Uncharacterized protein n=1 Tax=Haloferax profundi TaxID=1544718 RepID=A0A0W1R296_9EURY|nr:hypothetical protein AUR66_05010 [Haloferax profundi]
MVISMNTNRLLTNSTSHHLLSLVLIFPSSISGTENHLNKQIWIVFLWTLLESISLMLTRFIRA